MNEEQSAIEISPEDLLSIGPDLICAVDGGGVLRWVAPSAERVVGRPASALVGRRAADFLHPQDRENFDEVVRQAATRSAPVRFRARFRHDRGDYRRLDWAGHADAARDIVILAARDVTDLAASEILIESEARLRAILGTAAEGIITIDGSGAIEHVNKAALEMFGYEADELRGQNVSVLMPSPYRQQHQEYIERYRRTGERRIIGIGREVEGRRKDGSIFPIDLAVSEFRDGTGPKFAGIVRDLSERQRAEQKLRVADRLATIGTLVAGLGHDMNNTLLPARSRLEVLESLPLPEAARGHLAGIRQALMYLQKLTDSLRLLTLDPSDTEASAGVTVLHRWWEQVRPLLERSVPRLVHFEADIAESLPPVAIAQHRLTQVVLNLLVNAGEAVTSDGHVRLWARVGPTDETVEIGVTDDGEGMPPEVRHRALDPFFTTKKRGLGTGLGLSLVSSVVQSAAGVVSIESEVNRGTTVVVRLPSAPDDDAAARVPHRCTVSLDDPRLASMVVSVLESIGFDVDEAPRADPDDTAVWIVDDAIAPDDELAGCFLERPDRVLLVCGPDAAAWRRRGAVVIADVNDFEALRAGVGRATQILTESDE